MSEPQGAAPPPAPPEVPAWRLLLTLAAAGALAGLLLVTVYEATAEPIRRHKEKVLQEAVHEVLCEPAETVTLYLVGGALRAELPEGADARDFERVFLGLDESGRPVGYAIVAAEPGFQDLIHLIFGYLPGNRRLLGMRVLENKETPGLGDKIVKDPAFSAQFAGRAAPLKGVKAGKGTGAGTEVDMITGATISSRAVIRIINRAVERWQPLLEAYAAAGAPR